MGWSCCLVGRWMETFLNLCRLAGRASTLDCWLPAASRSSRGLGEADLGHEVDLAQGLVGAGYSLHIASGRA